MHSLWRLCRSGSFCRAEGFKTSLPPGKDSLLFIVGAVVMAFAIPTFYYVMNSPMTSKAGCIFSVGRERDFEI